MDMKTYNYGIDLMIPMQINRDIVFNEALLTIDSFCNSIVISFIDRKPSNPVIGEKYILTEGENINHICYCNNLSKGWQLLKAQDGMIIFIYKENSFFIFQQNEWNSLNMTGKNEVSKEVFKSTDTQFEIPRNQEYLYLYLYLNNNCTISLTKTREVTVILKQNNNNIYKISWPDNILWKNKMIHKMTETTNAIDIIKFYPLIETEHFLGEIIGQDYQF